MGSSPISLEKIIEALPSLDPDEVETLSKHLAALRSLDGVKTTSDDWLLRGIMAELADQGLSSTVPHNFRISNRRQFHGYLGKAEKVRSFFEEAMGSMTRVEKTVVAVVGARCLAVHIGSFRNITFNSMLQHVDMIPTAVEEAFPGYIRAGLLRAALGGYKLPRVAGRT